MKSVLLEYAKNSQRQSCQQEYEYNHSMSVNVEKNSHKPYVDSHRELMSLLTKTEAPREQDDSCFTLLAFMTKTRCEMESDDQDSFYY